ncbi:hypothetical protein [Motiliproteus sp. MSK22-1]|uniref:hypothetical protein n=1 Tax=Motiliproteus sp. MSK22-1 TaxID=1897630 RepID=UPI0009762536|nr:hypothetical protein [Motiliproteus sp. MSK22-1]OMH36202.1 hypothetical protein BGP75_10200 [Motiliproteus sp. MSK22-1]
MKKSEKKINNQLLKALTEACEASLERFDGFVWLTHFVNYSHFPDSLSVVCIFDTNRQLDNLRHSDNAGSMAQLIKQTLSAQGIEIKDINKHIRFDTEEACKKENAGKWNLRFNQRSAYH